MYRSSHCFSLCFWMSPRQFINYYYHYFFFFFWLYNSGWVLVCSTVLFHSCLSSTFALQPIIFILFRSSSTWSIHLNLGLVIFRPLQFCYQILCPLWDPIVFTVVEYVLVTVSFLPTNSFPVVFVCNRATPWRCTSALAMWVSTMTHQ